MLGRVSPKSRGRKVKTGRRGQRRVWGNVARASAGAATRPGAAWQSPSPARSEFADALAGQLKVLGDPESVPSAFQAEVATSVVLGNVTEAGTKEGIKPETTRELLVEAIRHMVEGLERRTPPYAYPVLRALAGLAPPEVAGYAAETAAELAGDRGALPGAGDGTASAAAGAPPWVDDLARVTPGACHVTEDEFGETLAVLCEFSYRGGTGPHCVFGVIDRAWHGAVTTLVVADEPGDKQLGRMEKDARRHGSKVREVSPAEAGRLLRDAIASFWKYGAAPGTDRGEGYGLLCSSLAIASARAAVLAPGAAVTDAAAERWPAEARRGLVEEFLASPQAAELRDPIARKVPHMLAMCCVGHLGCEPVLIGPSVLERVLVDALPRAAIAPDRFGKAVPQALRAWTDWLAERNKLADRSRRRLGFSLRAALVRFPDAWYGPAAHPLRRYLEDLSDEDASTGNVVNAVIERRVFAVPLPIERVDGLAEQSDGSRREATELDAAVQSDRTLITVMEASARGVPQQRFPSFVTVVLQLWDGDPPEVWEAARRLRDAGRSRDRVLDRLARTWDAHRGDDERYAAALKEL